MMALKPGGTMKLYEVLVLVGVIFQTQNDLVRFFLWVGEMFRRCPRLAIYIGYSVTVSD